MKRETNKTGAPKGQPHKMPGRGVLQIDSRGAMPFDNPNAAAEAMGVKQQTLKSWIGDGREHDGYRWEWEDMKEAIR
jgi:hypothetical protein